MPGEDNEGLVGWVADQTAGALRDAANMFTMRDAGFIADGEPESVPGKIVQAAARQACRRYADNSASVRSYARWKAESACRPYLDSIGYGAPPAVEQQLSGGQCVGETYRAVGELRWTVTGDFVGSPLAVVEDVATEFILVGPVTAQQVIYSDFSGVWQPKSFSLEFQTGGGLVSAFSKTNPSWRVSNARFVGSFEPLSGGTGLECGSPNPVQTPVAPPSTPGPKFEPFEFLPDVSVDIGVEVNPDGTIEITIGDDTETRDPFGEDPVAPTPSTPPPGDVGSPGSPSNTGVGGDTEGEAPPDSVLVGLKIDVLATPEFPNTYAPGVFRGACYIYMGTPAGLDQDFAGSMLMDGQFIYAEKENLTKWRVSANLGYNLRVTPYYREV